MLVTFSGTVELQDKDFDASDVRLAISQALADRKLYRGLKVNSENVMYSELRDTRKAMARDVLVVARKGRVNDWAAYIGAVPGQNHDREEEEVARHGRKLLREEAMVFFPQFDPAKYRP
jgi:hypothetical protein